MSFDLYFLEPPEDGDWDAALESSGEATDENGLAADRLELWNKLVVELHQLLPDAEVFESGESCELTDESSGIQIELFTRELALSIPYWYSGDGADHMVDVLRQVAATIEEVSGLVAYDPQADAPFIGDGDSSATASFDLVHRTLTGSSANDPVSDSAPKTRHWWRRILGG